MSVIKHSSTLTCTDGLLMGVDVFAPDGAEELPVVVICHGFKGFKDWGLFPPLAERLAERGRATVLFNFSHNGIGDVPDEFTRLDLFEQQTVSRHVEDLGLVFDAITSGAVAPDANLQRNDRYNAVGHSMGGAVAILRAAEDGRIVQVATLNGVAHVDRFGSDAAEQLAQTGKVVILNTRTGQEMPLGKAWFDDAADLDLEGAATQVFVPALVLQGEADPNVTPEEGQELSTWIAGSRLVVVAGGDHVFGAKQPFEGWTDPLERVCAELDEFLPHVGRLGGI